VARRARPDRFSISPLHADHDRRPFSCGVEALDRYLRRQAGQDARRRIAAPFLLVERGSTTVLGYYTLSATGVNLGELPDAVSRRLPAYPVVPATLLGRLAVDADRRGEGLGELLLIDALRRSWENSRQIASFAVVVNAKDTQAETFYRHYDFTPFPENTRKLFLPMATVAMLFE